MTIREAIKIGKERLCESGTALLDAEVLMQYVLGCEKESLFVNAENELEESLEALFFSYVQRVADGEPVAYVTGEKEFYGLDFFVDKRVLIPRPESEFIVEYAIKYLSELSEQNPKRFKLLDVGTGSGNLAIAIANYFQSHDWDMFDEILAIDISNDALDVAKINAAQYAIEDLVEFIEGDLLSLLDDGEFYDVIVANLPYIGEEKNRFVDANVEKYEPSGALFGGADGLELYDRMFQEIRDKEIEFSLMIGEFCFGQVEDVKILLEEYFPGRWRIEKDLAGIERFFIINSYVREA